MSSISAKFVVLDTNIGEVVSRTATEINGIKSIASSGGTGMYYNIMESKFKYKPITEYKTISELVKLGNDKSAF